VTQERAPVNSHSPRGRVAISLEDAQQRLLQQVQCMTIEDVALIDSYGRRCATDVRAPDPIPHYRRSGMDGYAIIAHSTHGANNDRPTRLHVIGEIPCGSVPTTPISATTAMRIMTGAMLPTCADAVVMLEMTTDETVDGSPFVMIQREIAPGANVSDIGADVQQNEILVSSGDFLGPAQIALLASTGFASVPVYRKPNVAIIATGSELLPLMSPLEPGKIRNSNPYMLAAQVLSTGANPVVYESLPDCRVTIERTVRQALACSDLVITIGGVSVGDYDYVAQLLAEWEGSLLFHKIRMRPGSVTSAATDRNGKLWLALSGNPGACFAGFELLARPVLQAIQGSTHPLPQRWPAVIAERFPKVNAYPRFIRGRLWNEEGRLYAIPSQGDQSSRMLPGVGADAFLIIPPGGSGVEAGTLIQTIPLRGDRG
jgi:molybdopterin molybdotransferase